MTFLVYAPGYDLNVAIERTVVIYQHLSASCAYRSADRVEV